MRRADRGTDAARSGEAPARRKPGAHGAPPAGPATGRAPRRWTRRHDLAVALALCVGAWIILGLTAADIGLTYDEPVYMSRSQAAQQWLSLLVTDPSAAVSPRVIGVLWQGKDEQPGLLKLTAAITSGVAADLHLLPSWAVAMTLLRTGTMFWVGLALGVMYLLLRAAGLGRAVSAFAPGALFFMPRVFGASHLLALDAPAMATCFLAAAAGWWAVERRDRLSVAVAGLALGAAIATKLNGFFVPFAVLPYALAVRPRRAGWLLLSYVVLGPLVFFATWPWLWHDTLQRLHGYLAFMWHHWQIGVMYFGHIYTLAPWHYAPVMTAITTPVVTLALALIGLGGWVALLARRALWRRRAAEAEAKAERGDAEEAASSESGMHSTGEAAAPGALYLPGTPLQRLWLLAGWALVVSLGPSMLPSSPKYGGVRLFLPAMAWLAVLAGLGLRPILLWLRRLIGGVGERKWAASAALLAAALLPSAAQVAHFYPFELSSYNVLIGGLPGAARRGMEPTYWGETYLQAARWLTAKAPEGARVWVDPTGMASVLQMYKYLGQLRPDIVVVAGPSAFASADYAVSQNKPTEFSRQVRDLITHDRPVWTDGLDGVPLIYVWRLRAAAARPDPAR